MKYCVCVLAVVLTAAVLAPAPARAAAGGMLYEDIISSDAGCRDLFWQGVDALGAGKLKDAKGAFGKALKTDGKCFLAYLLLSQIAYAEKDAKESTDYLRKIPSEPPELLGMYEDLTTLLRADDYARLATQAKNLLAAYPQTMTAVATLHLLARAQYYSGEKEDALNTFKAAFMYSDLAPGTVPAYGSQEEMNELETFAGRR